MNIVIFDPSLRDNRGTPSTNLGDLIIRDSIQDIVQEFFPDSAPTRLSSHAYPDEEQLDAAAAADICLVAGTNLLSSHITAYNQWRLHKASAEKPEPPRLNALLLGVGWWQYQDAPDETTTAYYRRVLAPEGPHSLRDGYSVQQLRQCGIQGLFNTSCPTMWKLDGTAGHNGLKKSKCLFTLTDYNTQPESDNTLIHLLHRLYPEQLIFFPQGSQDLEYIYALPAYQQFKPHIRILSHEYSVLASLEDDPDWDYIGTRLHAGIWSLAKGHHALILSIDNRAAEIGRETGLFVVPRTDFSSIVAWTKGKFEHERIQLPADAIAAWKKAFRAFIARRLALN